MKYKELEKEGITKDFLDTMNLKNLGNPVQLLPNDEPVNLIKNSTGYWVSLNGNILKNEKNEYITVKNEEAIIARARYLINFKEQIAKREGEIYELELKNQIDKEVKRLKELTIATVKKHLSNTKTVLQLAGLLKKDFEFTLQDLIFQQNGTLEEATTEALKLTSTGGYLEHYEKIKELYDNGNLDSLYIYFFQKGIPEIASFQTNDLLNNSDIDVLIKYFHRDKFEDTIDEIQSKSHIQNVAKFLIEKKILNNNS